MILHTESYGSGEPVVFLHSGLQTASTDFEYQQQYFKDGYRVIAPDLRGHGKSINADLSDFFEDTARDLSATLENLEIESAHIVGASLGALAGLFFAKRFPGQVKSLAMSGVTPERPANWTQMHEEEAAFQQELLKNEEAAAYFDGLHQGDWRRFLEIGRSESWYPFEETGNLSGIRSPILFIAGEESANETKGAFYYPEKFNNVHVAVIPFASHLVHAQQPEIYTGILEAFLNKEAG